MKKELGQVTGWGQFSSALTIGYFTAHEILEA